MCALEVKFGRTSLAVKYTSIFFPFDIAHMLKTLSRQGYFIPEELEEAELTRPLRARLEASGIVARKADIAIYISVDRRIVGVRSPSEEAAIAEMESLESLLADEFAFDSPAEAQYYEFLANFTIEAKQSPLESWEAHLGKVPLVREVSNLFGTELSPFGLRLAPPGTAPNQPDWFDIRIEPHVQSPDSRHHIEIVFRRTDRQEIVDFVQDLRERLEKVLSLLGGG